MTMWSVDMADGHLDVIRGLADELEHVDGINYRDAPMWSDVLINSSGSTGWMVAVHHWWGLTGSSEDLAALCRSLVAVGRKREREIAGRIRDRALAKGAPAADWAGESPSPKPSAPRSIDDVARAWKQGKPMRSGNIRTDGLSLYSWRLCIGKTSRGKKVAFDHRQSVSRSTSRHVGAAIEHADRVVPKERG